MKFEGKCALVTGAAGGIGGAIVRLLRAKGARGSSRRDTSGIDAEAHFPGDLTDVYYANNLPAEAAKSLGGLDILINNAGIMRRGPVTASTDDDFDISVAVNIKAPFQLCRAAMPLMAENGGGAIVNTASCWGVRPGPDHAVYCMSKAALASLTQCMGRDHAHQGIRINAVCPNEVDTPMLRTGFELLGFDPTTAVTELDKTVPLGRIAQPEDIADVVLFLASDQARYMCGELLEINGGMLVG
jgi:NAD(P)-dependent dehydrogenase (short-subunit alcohol dehydrogenase family)